MYDIGLSVRNKGNVMYHRGHAVCYESPEVVSDGNCFIMTFDREQ